MFNSITIKVLIRENASLRRQLRERDRTVSELLDRFINNKAPERIVERTYADRSNSPTHQTSLPSDAYSAAINDAEKQALLKLGIPEEETQDDDEV